MCRGELSAVISQLIMSKCLLSVKRVEVGGSEEIKKCPPPSLAVLWFVNGRDRKPRWKKKSGISRYQSSVIRIFSIKIPQRAKRESILYTNYFRRSSLVISRTGDCNLTNSFGESRVIKFFRRSSCNSFFPVIIFLVTLSKESSFLFFNYHSIFANAVCFVQFF